MPEAERAARHGFVRGVDFELQSLTADDEAPLAQLDRDVLRDVDAGNLETHDGVVPVAHDLGSRVEAGRAGRSGAEGLADQGVELGEGVAVGDPGTQG